MLQAATTIQDPSVRVALYARVSSEQQAQAGTIASQVEAIRQRVAADGLCVEPEMCFIDDGCSGTTLIRPALERLRDLAAAGGIDRLYVLCPDRLARNYAYQMLLVDELRRCGLQLVFINRELGQTPEDHLLLQVQGMVAEYERAKIMERSRRGKLHAARQGNVSVMSVAPFGYRYLRAMEGARAQYDIHPEEAAVVRQIFQWVGVERASLGQVCRRLQDQSVVSPSGRATWSRTTLWGILRNPAYKGQAAFGKTCLGPMRPRLRSGRHRREHPRNGQGQYRTSPDQWISIPVPAVVEQELFDTVALQMQENQKRFRAGRREARFLLQGLLVCKCCGYAYYGIGRQDGSYGYYRCAGTDAYRFGGHRVCSNQQVRQDLLDQAVWQDVRSLLADPQRIEQELHRRLQGDDSSPQQQVGPRLTAQIGRVRRGIARLIDAYEAGLVEKAEFEPRVKLARSRLSQLEEQLQSHCEEQARARDLRAVADNLQVFARQMAQGMENADWATRREVIRTLVKRVEVEQDQVTVVYRVDINSPFDRRPESGVLHYCSRRVRASA